MVTPLDSISSLFIGDIDEVTYLEQYYAQTPANVPAPVQNTEPTSKTPAKTTEPTKRPLIDMVTPQPKAFFAYLQMPPKSRAKTAPKRIRRRKVGEM